MASFDDMLAALHTGANIRDAESGEPIVVNSKRQFVIPNGYNLTLAYEGDVNSQIVTFKLPRFHENHDLSACVFKALRWKNLSTNVEDWSTLEQVVEPTTEHQFLKWVVPPTAFVAAGTIEIAISLYDLYSNKIAFSWNTATYSGFKVEKTLSDIGYRGQVSSYRAPAKNEVLRIYEEGRNIVAPQGYNFTIANYGAENTAVVHFQSNRIVGGIDLLNADTTISIFVSLQKATGEYYIDAADIHSTFAEDSKGEGMVNFVWRVPPAITYNVFGYKGSFSITVCFKNNTKTWLTAQFNKLTIGSAVIYNQDETLPTEYYNILDGNAENVDLTPRTAAGIIKLRSNNLSQIAGKTIGRNEMVVIYDDTSSPTSLYNVKIGQSNGQSLSGAPDFFDIIESFLKETELVVNANKE